MMPPAKVRIMSKAMMLNHCYEPLVPSDEAQFSEENLLKYTDYTDLFSLNKNPFIDEIWILPAIPCYIYQENKRVHLSCWIPLHNYEDGGFSEDEPNSGDFWNFQDIYENLTPR